MERRNGAQGSALGGAQDAGLFGALVTKAVAHRVAERAKRGVGDGVVGGGANGPPRDDACLEQDRKVLADVGLRGIEPRHQLADAQFAGLEQFAQDGEPPRIAEDAEAGSDLFEELGRDEVSHAANCITMQL